MCYSMTVTKLNKEKNLELSLNAIKKNCVTHVKPWVATCLEIT